MGGFVSTAKELLPVDFQKTKTESVVIFEFWVHRE